MLRVEPFLQLVGQVLTGLGTDPVRFLGASLRSRTALALAVGRISEWIADHVTGRMPMATVEGVRLARRCPEFDSQANLAELGLGPRPMEESACDAVDWYRKVGRI